MSSSVCLSVNDLNPALAILLGRSLRVSLKLIADFLTEGCLAHSFEILCPRAMDGVSYVPVPT